MNQITESLAVLGTMSPVWRRSLLMLTAVMVVLFALFGSSFMAMVVIWERSGTFAHAFVVPPISAWLVWRRRAELLALTPRPMPWLLVPLALFGGIWMLGEMTATNSVTQLMFVALFITCVAAVLGRAVTRRLAFPLLFLFFCVPIGEFLLPTLMEHTADFTVSALRLSGIPVFREGTDFVIPSGRWSVVEACSGVRYLIASLMVGTLFAYLSYSSIKRRLAFMVVAFILPVVANWLRAYGIVMLGHLSGNKLATGVDHLIYGWIFFGVVMFAMFMIGARWSEPEAESLPPSADEKQAAAHGQGGSTAGLLAVGLATAVMLAWPLLALRGMEAHERTSLARALQLPSPELTGWQGGALPLVPWQPKFVSPAGERLDYFERDGQKVGLALAYFRQQDFDSKLVNSAHHDLPRSKDGWSVAGEREMPVTVGGKTVAMRVNLFNNEAGERLLVGRLYWLQGHWTSSDYLAKIDGVVNRLEGHGDDAAALVLIAKPAADGSAPAVQRLMAENAVTIDALLASMKTRGARPAPSADN